jgi:hypothetical protein
MAREAGGERMTPPEKGHMRLYPSIRPRLNAGPHTLRTEQSISGGGPIDPLERHLVVDAPRFSMAGAEVLSMFPPPNAVGAFANRLPQIALKRRTLPWERAPRTLADPIETRRPWLALVVLADGEGNLRTGVPVDQAMPADVRSRMGVSETGTCDLIELPRTVVDKVFPREDELELLCHVREVNLLDTEFASSDDDGFVSVVISSRLPRPQTRYGAYLVSIEGRLDELPDPGAGGFSETIEGGPRVYPPERIATAIEAARAGEASAFLTPTPTREAKGAPPALGWARAAEAATPTGLAAKAGVATPAGRFAGFVAHDLDVSKLELELEVEVLRFPVLAHWEFTCDEGGDFQSLMTHLDVGLLGTAPGAPEQPPPDAPPARPIEVAPTGHTSLAHLTRGGESAVAWYRGAFTPREVRRREKDEPPYQAADQARRIAEDRREDLSEAAAFEIGRLLALADPRFVAELQAWRRSGYLVNRARSVLDHIGLLERVGEVQEALARRLGGSVLAAVGSEAERFPRVRPGDVEHLLDEGDAGAIARGLGVDAEAVAQVLAAEVTTAAFRETALDGAGLETDLGVLAEDPSVLGGLRAGLDETVEGMGEQAERGLG